MNRKAFQKSMGTRMPREKQKQSGRKNLLAMKTPWSNPRSCLKMSLLTIPQIRRNMPKTIFSLKSNAWCMKNARKYYLWSLGCQMNKSDAERIENVLQLMGYRAVDHENDANIIGVVSCSVRQAAMDRVHGRITRWNEMKKSRPVITLLTGCVLPHDREQVGRKFDILLDLNDLRSLPQQVS